MKSHNVYSLFSPHLTPDDINTPSPPALLPAHTVTFTVLSYRRVQRELLSLETSKANGPDGVLKRSVFLTLRLSFVVCFCLGLKTSMFPSSWKDLFVQPVLKMKAHSNPTKYHPILYFDF